jgi:hypothetical protein
MTLRTLYTVDCDGRADGSRHPRCREWVGTIGTEQVVRRQRGWRQVLAAEPGGPADRCPECAGT